MRPVRLGGGPRIAIISMVARCSKPIPVNHATDGSIHRRGNKAPFKLFAFKNATRVNCLKIPWITGISSYPFESKYFYKLP